MKQNTLILTFILFSFGEACHAYIDARGFPSQGQPARAVYRAPPVVPTHRVQHSPVIINNYYYQLPYDYDLADYPDDSYARMPPSTELSGPQWVRANSGAVPTQARVYRYVEGAPAYRCRVVVGIDYAYGDLISGRGCKIRLGASTTFYQDYETYISD